MTIYFATAGIALACIANSYGIWMLARAHRLLSGRVRENEPLWSAQNPQNPYATNEGLLAANFPVTQQQPANIDRRIL